MLDCDWSSDVCSSDLVKDVHNYGALDVTGVITKSSNVGVTKLALDMEPEYLWRSFQRFGVGEATETRLRGEVLGVLPHFKRWSRFEQATHSFGYGLSVTAVQLARAYAVLAADGVRRPVTMFKTDQVPAGERVLKASTAQAMQTMMETVVSAKGTALKAAVPGYRVAGKTGTAKKSVGGVYVPGHYQSVFAGMVPASRPRMVMVIMIDEPRGHDYYGGLVAAPVFSRVMSEALRLLNIPPDGEIPVEPRMAGGEVPRR
jgi:cell division protein FtsI (penicillin-binding protein 3)